MSARAWTSASPPWAPPRYQYQLRCQLTGVARLERLGIVNDLQMAPLTLPGLVLGNNTFTYTDQSGGERKVRITHEWVERSASKPPAAPPVAIYPADGGEAEGTEIRFQWQAPSDPDGNPIADYQFELSNRSDMKWPLSMNFYKIVSRTPDRGKAQYTLPEPGLLNPDRPYYWHVRAKDDKGVWGPWSKTWSFTARGPAYPVEVAMSYDADRGVGTLKWKPNPVGRKAAKYRVYGSDERGFSISDVPYKVRVGATKELKSPFPANFIAETEGTELQVIGSEVALPEATKTYYRVVAVDDRGNRSGPSDYATAPRPIIYSKPVLTAKSGSPYRYEVKVNRCLGDLRLNGRSAQGFFDIEKPKFAIQRGPAWLKIDAATGILSGTPEVAGKAEVSVAATIDRDVRILDEGTLKWGNEKVASVKKEKVGSAVQSFVIEVGR